MPSPPLPPPLWLLAFYETVLLSCFVLLCYEIVLQELGRLLPLRGLIDWQLWCCMKSRFDWWGLRPSGSLAGGALRERRLYGRSVLLNGAHFELSALLSGWQWTYNKCTSSSVCATSTTRTVRIKPWWAARGGWGVAWGYKQERKTEGKKRYGEQSEGKRKRNDTKGQSDRHADNKKEERERKTKCKETEHQWSATEQYVTQIWQRNKTDERSGKTGDALPASRSIIIHEARSVIHIMEWLLYLSFSFKYPYVLKFKEHINHWLSPRTTSPRKKINLHTTILQQKINLDFFFFGFLFVWSVNHNFSLNFDRSVIGSQNRNLPPPTVAFTTARQLPPETEKKMKKKKGTEHIPGRK